MPSTFSIHCNNVNEIKRCSDYSVSEFWRGSSRFWKDTLPSLGCSNLKAYTAKAPGQWSLHHPLQCQWTECWNFWLSPVTSDFFLCFAYLDQKEKPVSLATSLNTTLQSKKINQKPKYTPYNIYIFNAFN